MAIIYKHFKHRVLCLAHKSIFLVKPDYLNNQLNVVAYMQYRKNPTEEDSNIG